MTTKYSDLTNDELARLVAGRVLHMPYIYEPTFSTSMDSCLEHVIPAMRERGFLWETRDNYNAKEVRETFTSIFTSRSAIYMGLTEHKSLPRACCIAALLAVDAMEKEL